MFVLIKETKNKIYVKINNKFYWLNKNEIEDIDMELKKEEEQKELQKKVTEAIKKDYKKSHEEFLEWREKNKDKLEYLAKKIGW